MFSLIHPVETMRTSFDAITRGMSCFNPRVPPKLCSRIEYPISMILRELVLRWIQVPLVPLRDVLCLIDRVTCSSSLVALHLDCNAMRAGETRMTIVGGSNLILSHEPMVDLSMLRYDYAHGMNVVIQPC